VRAVARAHGGDVTGHSSPGEGSKFELTLPQPTYDRLELPARPEAVAQAGLADQAPLLDAPRSWGRVTGLNAGNYRSDPARLGHTGRVMPAGIPGHGSAGQAISGGGPELNRGRG